MLTQSEWLRAEIKKLTDEIEITTPSIWAEQNRYLPDGVTPLPGFYSYDVAPYLKEITDYMIFATNAADARGGGPLWAIDGVACVAHGRSIAEEFARVIEQAQIVVEKDIVGSIKAELAKIRSKIDTDVY